MCKIVVHFLKHIGYATKLICAILGVVTLMFMLAKVNWMTVIILTPKVPLALQGPKCDSE